MREMRLPILLGLLASLFLPEDARAWTLPASRTATRLFATVAPTTDTTTQDVLQSMTKLRDEAVSYADMFDLGPPNAALFALFGALRQSAPLGLKGQPLYLTSDQVAAALGQATEWPGFFDIHEK